MLLRGLRRASSHLIRSTGPRAVASARADPPAARRDKEPGDISSVFVSLSDTAPAALPDRFRQLKRRLVRGKERELVAGWSRLLRQLRRENEVIAGKGSSVIPQVDFADIEAGCGALDLAEVRKRGVLVERGVIPEDEARAYKHDIDDYVRWNPHTRAFPPRDPQVYEFYWSAPQLKARSHASLLRVQRLLMASFWHSSCPTAELSLTRPLTYADRLRIRKPGDSAFALGPHMDGGSVERWEPDGYGRGGAYASVFAGQWEQYDPWDAAGRLAAVTDLYNGLGACSVFRMWQGWLSMSATGPSSSPAPKPGPVAPAFSTTRTGYSPARMA